LSSKIKKISGERDPAPSPLGRGTPPLQAPPRSSPLAPRLVSNPQRKFIKSSTDIIIGILLIIIEIIGIIIVIIIGIIGIIFCNH